jgi:thiol-disulfide isomerase/thioredoxin
MLVRLYVMTSLIALAAACSGGSDAPTTMAGSTGAGANGSGPTSSGATMVGSGAGGTAAACEASVEPFGTEDGESFPDLELTACDGSKVSLDAVRCEHSITLVSVGAGWCEPCKEEAPELQAAAEALGDQGVGVVQVMFQDAGGLPATTLFCDNWTTQFGLTIPVFIDPVGNTLEFFEQAQTPLNFVIDRDGKVLWAMTGKPDDIQAVLTSLLP